MFGAVFVRVVNVAALACLRPGRRSRGEHALRPAKASCFWNKRCSLPSRRSRSRWFRPWNGALERVAPFKPNSNFGESSSKRED